MTRTWDQGRTFDRDEDTFVLPKKCCTDGSVCGLAGTTDCTCWSSS